MTNLTYSKALEVAIAEIADPAIKEKLSALKIQIDKKSSAERKPTKTQVENAELKERILDFLFATEGDVTATDVANAFCVSNQKATALLTAMVANSQIVREIKGRKSFFKAVA